MSGMPQFTVSLVTYKTEISEIMPVVSGVLESSCCTFYIVDNGNDSVLAAEIAALQSEKIVYIPRENNRRTYNALYEEYRRLCVYFAEGENPVMKRLRNL